ncbi:MAG: hypothetical protein IJJ99_00305 [Oscillospiraceae bacterium]|nr:hypothetical protein [Oscillospiraceae bacterium]
MNCLRCGTQIAENALFCENCKKTVGEPLQESAYLNTQIILPTRKAQPPRPAQTKTAKKAEHKPEEDKPRGRGAIAILTVLCLLLLAGATYLGTLWLDGKNDNAALAEQVTGLEKQVVSLEDKTAVLEGQATALEEQTAALEEQLASRDMEYDELEEKAAGLETDKSKLQQKLNFINANVAFLPNDGTYLYHTGDCTHFDKTGFLVFSVSTAISWGYRPCPYCQPAE